MLCSIVMAETVVLLEKNFYAVSRTCMAYRLRPGNSMNAPATTATVPHAASMPSFVPNHWSQDAVAEVSAGTHVNRGSAPARAASATCALPTDARLNGNFNGQVFSFKQHEGLHAYTMVTM